MDNQQLTEKSASVRRAIFDMIMSARKGHIGGSLSCVDILVALYSGHTLRFDPQNPRWPDRDRFILSKGHACEALYAVLAEKGFFPVDVLETYGKPGTILGGHVDNSIPGVDVSTGSLGHGLGIGAGIALSARLDQKDFLTFVLMGDGECYEGSVWEAAMFASHHHLSNLIAIVDRNKQITLDFTENCNRLEPFDDKWRSFGWEVVSLDGNKLTDLLPVFQDLRKRQADQPIVIIANTIKGKGVSFMEGNLSWHHNLPKGEQVETARKDLRFNG
jgi:transketolase